MRLLLSLTLLCLSIVGAAAQGSSNEPAWVKIDSRPAPAAEGTVTFDVAKVAGQWRAMRIETRGGDINLVRVEIRYLGGARYTEARTIALLEGERTRPLDFGPDRFVDEVTVAFTRDRAVTSEPALELWGLQSPAGAKAQRDSYVPPATVAASEPAASREILIGMQRKQSRVDSDVFPVGEIGKFLRLKVRAPEGEVRIDRATVIYADGQADTVGLSSRLKKGMSSAWINARPDLFITRVELTYEPRRTLSGPPTVELIGELAPGWVGPRGSGRDYNGGWVLLGAQTAGFFGFDRDLFPVSSNEGGFRNLRFVVKDRAITLDEVRIVYGTGGVQVIQYGKTIEAGTTFGPVAVDPARPIRELRVRYRSRYVDRAAKSWRPAIVEVWGEH